MNRFTFVCLVPLVGLLTALPALAAAAPEGGHGFELKDTAGDHLDVLLDGKIVARYMYAHDTSSKERRLETYKPYLHVFDAEGTAPITKGPGGNFTHHRGIFIGWQQISYEGKKYNLWEMGSGDIVHQKFVDEKATPDEATFTSETKWTLSNGTTILEEQRTLTFHRALAPARLLIDFTSKLTATAGDLTLEANAEHGGVQFRPANEIDTKQTTYVFPKENANPHTDRDYPWVGETFTLNGKKHSVVEMSHPDDPKGTEWSAYRDYGRFGALTKNKLKKGEMLTLKYRFLIADGDMPPATMIQKSWDQFAGVTTPTPTPTITVKPAEKGGPGSAKPTTKKNAAPKAKAK